MQLLQCVLYKAESILDKRCLLIHRIKTKIVYQKSAAKISNFDLKALV